MPTIDIDITKFAQLTGAEFVASRRGIQRGMLEGAMRCLPTLHDSTRSAPPANPAGIGIGGAVNTGAYLRAWKVRRLHSGGGLGSVWVGNTSVQAAVIEHGRRPGARMPPVQPLVRWVQRRLGVPLEQAQGLGFLIARAIQRRGLRARRVMTRVLPQMEAHVRDAIDKRVEEELGRLRARFHR